MSKKVTAKMREAHFNCHGYMVDDNEILRWYKNNKLKKENKIEDTK